MTTSLRSVIPVWVVALLGAVLVGVVAPDAALQWIPVVMVGAILFTFVLQLSLSRKEGLLERIVASLSGALLILAAATLVLWLSTVAVSGTN